MTYHEASGTRSIIHDFVYGASRTEGLLPPPPSLEDLAVQVRGRQPRASEQESLWKEVWASTRILAPHPEGHGTRQRLIDGDAVAVVAIQRPAVFGGLISDLAKTMTAVKLASCLTRSGLPAVPLCVLVSTPGGEEEEELGFFDGEGDFRECTVALDPGAQGERTVSRAAVEWLDRFSLILGRHPGTAPLLEKARAAFPMGAPVKEGWPEFTQAVFQHATILTLDFDRLSPAVVRAAVGEGFGARAMSTLAEWSGGMQRAGYDLGPNWVLAREAEGDSLPDRWAPVLLTGLLSPAVAAVADPEELPAWCALSALCLDVQRDPPRIWPRAAFTAVDSRSRKLLARYRIPPEILYEGPAALLSRVFPEHDGREVSGGIRDLQDAADVHGRALREMVGAEAYAEAGAERPLTRIRYQLEKLAERSERHRARRVEVLEDRFRRLCTRLAPEGGLQESRLAALQILAEGSDGIAERLSQAMKITSWQHQFLYMD